MESNHNNPDKTNSSEMKVAEYADILIKQFLKKKYFVLSGTIYTSKAILLTFTKGVDFKFNEITPSFIGKYRSFLKDNGLDSFMVDMLIESFHHIYLYAITNKIISKDSDPFDSCKLYDITMMN
jgi:hypothetical protein